MRASVADSLRRCSKWVTRLVGVRGCAVLSERGRFFRGTGVAGRCHPDQVGRRPSPWLGPCVVAVCTSRSGTGTAAWSPRAPMGSAMSDHGVR